MSSKYKFNSMHTYLISMTLANMPAEAAPWVVVAKVRKMKAAVELHPEYANATTKIP